MGDLFVILIDLLVKAVHFFMVFMEYSGRFLAFIFEAAILIKQ